MRKLSKKLEKLEKLEPIDYLTHNNFPIQRHRPVLDGLNISVQSSLLLKSFIRVAQSIQHFVPMLP